MTFKNSTQTGFVLSVFAAMVFLATGQSDSSAQDKDQKPEKDPATRWEKSIADFEKRDQKQSPKKESVLFLGSSSIRMWDLNKWFPKADYINRGFGGSEISDSIYFFDRLVTKYSPQTVVFYAGDNDIAKGKSPERVAKDFQVFAEKMKSKLPNTRIVFVAIKPSLSRWKLVEKMRKANLLIKNYADEHKLIDFADIDTPMIGKDGKPKPDLFLKDGLHLNDAGYKVWYDVVQPLLEKQQSLSKQ